MNTGWASQRLKVLKSVPKAEAVGRFTWAEMEGQEVEVAVGMQEKL